VAVNVAAAIKAADELFDAGFIPFVPHLTHFWHLICPRPYADWLDLDLLWLEQCDALLRLPGDSAGADGEVAKAKGMEIPCFSTVAEVIECMTP
jgi:hypothetical protein